MKLSRGVQSGPWYKASISVRGTRTEAAIRPASVVLPEPDVPATRIRRSAEGRASWNVSTSSPARERTTSGRKRLPKPPVGVRHHPSLPMIPSHRIRISQLISSLRHVGVPCAVRSGHPLLEAGRISHPDSHDLRVSPGPVNDRGQLLAALAGVPHGVDQLA